MSSSTTATSTASTTAPSPVTPAAPAAPATPETPCAYSIGRRLSLLLAVQTVIGLSVLLAIIYGATTMLFTAKHEEELRSYTAVLVDVVRDAGAAGGEAEVMAKLAWLSERRPGTFVQIFRADGSELYRDKAPSFDVATAHSRTMPFTVPTSNAAGPLQGTLVLDCSQDATTAKRMALLLIAAVLAGAALAGWGTFWRVRSSLRPLIDLAAQTKAIDARHLGQRQ